MATQTSDEDSEERGRRKKPANLRAILAESGFSNLMADFPVLIIWQQVMEFLNSFHPVDAFHLTLWGFAVVAAFGEVIVSSVVSSLFCQHHSPSVAPVWPDGRLRVQPERDAQSAAPRMQRLR